MKRIIIGGLWGGLSVLLLAMAIEARTYTIRTKAQWETWAYPRDILQVNERGELHLVYMRKHIDAMANAHTFSHQDAQKIVRYGGAFEVGSNPKDAPKAVDGDPNTWWAPDPEDDLENWWITVDLGRLVAGTKLRLIFADTLGVRPFEQFAAYASPGVSTIPGEDVFDYMPVGRTTKPNQERVVEYELQYARHAAGDTTQYGEYWEATVDFLPIQYVMLVLDAKTARAGLAEVQVESVGDNLALGTLDRGGSWLAGTGRATDALFDGELKSFWQILKRSESVWKEEGAYFEWDLGALFWLDQIHFFGSPLGWGGVVSRGQITNVDGYIIGLSEGARTPSGEIDYEQIVDVDNREPPYEFFFKHTFPRRKARYLFLRHAHGAGAAIWSESRADITEMQIYGEGYPAGVTIESDFIDLGEIAGDRKAKNITAIGWVGDFPPGTKVEIRTKSGNALEDVIHYYDQGGTEISKDKWERTPVSRRGPKEVTLRAGSDWSGYSEPYQWSGERFLSPSLRRYMQFKVRILSDDPEIAPSLHSLSVMFDTPVLKSVVGEVFPRFVEADRDTLLRYRIYPAADPGELGFDRVLIRVPSAVDPERVEVFSAGEALSFRSVRAQNDSLLIHLSSYVRDKVIEIDFPGKVLENATRFDAFVGDSRRADFWQSVDPRDREFTTVYVPSLAESSALIGNLVIAPGGITPNGDGVNDQATIRFSVFKVERAPVVTIYSLHGETVVEALAPQSESEHVYHWDGRDAAGKLVPPGMYLCRIRVDADSGNRTAHRTISVVY